MRSPSTFPFHRRAPLAAAALLSAAAGAQPAAGPAPVIRADAFMKVSAHVYVIPDDNARLVPNVGIVVGERATLVVDTGLGERNGRIVLGAAADLGGDEYYIAATHYHPEHDLGAAAFPTDAKLVRSRAQQAEIDEAGAETIERFSSFSPEVAELLSGAGHRAADILFEDEVTIDLGGVRVKAVGVGPNHTRGDTVFFVEEDGVLFTGDVVMKVFPSVSAQSGSIEKWLANLDAFEALEPATIVPAHGPMGDAELIRRYREYLAAVRDAVADAKRRGESADEAAARLAEDLAARFPDLAPPAAPAAGRITAAIRAAYREAD